LHRNRARVVEAARGSRVHLARDARASLRPGFGLFGEATFRVVLVECFAAVGTCFLGDAELLVVLIRRGAIPLRVSLLRGLAPDLCSPFFQGIDQAKRQENELLLFWQLYIASCDAAAFVISAN